MMAAGESSGVPAETTPRTGWFKRYVLGLFGSVGLGVYGAGQIVTHYRQAASGGGGAQLQTGAVGWYALAAGLFLLGRFFLWEHRWFRRNVAGLGLGVVLAGYGLVALLMHHTFLPGLIGGSSTVSGARGAGLAFAYIAGGLHLVLRLWAQPRARSAGALRLVYNLQNAVLIVLIGSLLYVLWQVGAVG